MWVVVVLLVGLQLAFMVSMFVGNQLGRRPGSLVGPLVLSILVGVGLPVFLYSLQLVTEVRDDGLYVRFRPIHFSYKRIAFDEIRSYESRKYHPLMEYGGWGIRYGLKGKAYNVRGDLGIQLEFVSGKRLLIGTQRPEEFLHALKMKIPAKASFST